MFCVCFMYVYAQQETYDKALKYFSKAPESDMQSQYQLGVIYFDGLGLDKPDYVSI